MFHTVQLFEPNSSTFSYLLVDKQSSEAVIIDPVAECLKRDLELIRKLGLRLEWILETHIHADHITSAFPLSQETGAKIALSARAAIANLDRALSEGDKILFGSSTLSVLETPGHTDTCLSYYAPAQIFTGDALLIGGNGRTDFQQGDAKTLYHSIRKKLFTLADETTVYPAHNYQGIHSTTIGWEKKTNTRIREDISEEEFVKIMAELKLPPPKQIDRAVSGNLNLGKID